MVDFKAIEKKWQKKWEDKKVFEADDDPDKHKFYVLEMYPYPSGSGLHMGHARNYSLGDIYARFKRMQGFNVLYPMGFDSFGLPAENAAIKAKSHPKKFTEAAITNFIKQMKTLGLSYDWNRMIQSHDPEYYKWDQWIFLKMFEKDLAYKKKANVNWCRECNTVLANEQVHNGKCWRHTETEVELKPLEQWFFKTTAYAEELYNDIDKLKHWAEDVKAMQRNWIGKSHGVEIKFEIEGEDWEVFTTRADTLFGVTFLVVAAQHPKLMELVKGTKHEDEVREFVKKIHSTKQEDLDKLDKEGVFTGKYATHPLTGEKIPVWAGNFVVADYGSGMVMAVPAHDERDFEFAQKYDIPVKVVIDSEVSDKAYSEYGTLIDSAEFSGQESTEAIRNIAEVLKAKEKGESTVQYRLKDWLISRQRFWGTPIPIIYCSKCGVVPVPEDDLPVKLPEDITFTSEKNPLKDYEDFVNVKCPKCDGDGKRETDTMDTFVNSSWYFLRYTDPKNKKAIFDPAKANYWMPVDLYIGGKEHACMHLIYFRFYTKFLRDLGLLSIDEPTTRLFNQGMLHGPDGSVMAKSKGNVVLPEEISEKYGIDTARFFLMHVAGPDKDMNWDDHGIAGSYKSVNKIFNLLDKEIGSSDAILETKMHSTIKAFSSYMEDMKFNLALIDLMEFVKYLSDRDSISSEALENVIKMINPFCPHMAEEMWNQIGKNTFVNLESWPCHDESKINEEILAVSTLVENTRADIINVMKLAKVSSLNKITLFVAADWKYDFFKSLKKVIAKTRDISEVIKKTMIPEFGKEISSLVPKVMKDNSKIPLVVLDQATEANALINELESLNKEFGCSVEVVRAEDSSHSKASQAMPGKVAILVE